jgi:hypothetical protein
LASVNALSWDTKDALEVDVGGRVAGRPPEMRGWLVLYRGNKELDLSPKSTLEAPGVSGE